MKKLINKIPDRYYLISMAFILFIMVLGRYMFPDLMKKWDMVLYFLPQLFLPFTIIAVLYFYVKNNHSQAVIDFLTVNEDEIFMIINKK